MVAPVLISLSPDYATVGSDTPVTISISGTGFLDSSVLVWNGADDVCVFVSETELTTVIAMDTVTVASTATVAVRNDVDLSNELTFEFREEAAPPPDSGDNSGIYDQPPQGYTTLDDTYGKIAEETAWPEGTSATGEPSDPEEPTSNTEGGGLPMFAKEPYPTGNPPTRSYEEIRKGSPPCDGCRTAAHRGCHRLRAWHRAARGRPDRSS